MFFVTSILLADGPLRDVVRPSDHANRGWLLARARILAANRAGCPLFAVGPGVDTRSLEISRSPISPLMEHSQGLGAIFPLVLLNTTVQKEWLLKDG